MQALTDNQIDGWNITYIRVADGALLRVMISAQTSCGETMPLIMIPGLGSVPENFSLLLDNLRKHFKIFLIETREKNSSKTGRNHQFAMQDLANDVAEIISRILPEQSSYAVLGYSMGGAVFLEAFSKIVEKPCCTVLVSLSARFPFPSWLIPFSYIAVPLFPVVRPFLKSYIRKKHVNTESDPEMHEIQQRVLDAADAGKLAKTIRGIASYNVWHTLSEIRIPVLLITASKDTLHHHNDMHLLAEQLPQCRVVDLETNDRTHGLEAAVVIRNFIGENTAG
ncbi:MAG: alpha/beta fold hydrolase [Bacteroidales bacterium]